MPSPVSALSKIKNMFSPLERAVAAHKMESMSSAQWAAYIKANAPKSAKKEALAVKLDELLARQPKISKQEIIKHIQDNSPKVKTKIVRAESNDGDETMFSTYVLPGGEDYAETILSLPPNPSSSIIRQDKAYQIYDANGKLLSSGRYPMSPRMEGLVERNPDWKLVETTEPNINDLLRDPANFGASHFEEPNVVAHLRTNTKLTPDKKDVLFLEELQSDWAQMGRKKGFRSVEDEAQAASHGELAKAAEDKFNGLKRHISELVGDPTIATTNSTEAGIAAAKQAGLESEYIAAMTNMWDAHSLRNFTDFKLPNAPYVGDTADWTALGLKKAIERAVDEGQSHLAWTTGTQQADRYNLAKQLDRVQATKYGDEWAIAGYNGNAETINHTAKSN
jgi:hypothetical protein